MWIFFLNFIFKSLLKEPAMIVYNSFQGHLEESVKTKFKQHNFYLAVISAELISLY